MTGTSATITDTDPSAERFAATLPLAGLPEGPLTLTATARDVAHPRARPHRGQAMSESNELTDKELHSTLSLFREPINGFTIAAAYWGLGLIGIRREEGKPLFTNGFHMDLWPESRVFKRWFDFPDLGKAGWAIVLRVWDANSNPRYPGDPYDQYIGWVPPEREKEADHWIAFLNQEIRARLREAGKTPTEPDPSHGAIPPPAPPGPIPVPPLLSSVPLSQRVPAGLARQRQEPSPEPPPSPLPPAIARRKAKLSGLDCESRSSCNDASGPNHLNLE